MTNARDAPSGDAYAPRRVDALRDVVDLDTEEEATCALRKDGAVLCAFAPLDPYAVEADDPPPPVAFTAVARFEGARSIAVSKGTVCAVLADGGVACAGSDRHGGRALGGVYGEGQGAAPPPSRVADLTGVRRLVAGRHQLYGGFCALGADERARCWGFGNPAQFSAGSIREADTSRMQRYAPARGRSQKLSTPTLLAGVEGVDDIAWWDDGICVRRTTGALECRGMKGIDRKRLDDARGGALAAGPTARCAISAAEGRLSCWDTVTGSLLARVALLSDVASVAVGARHACALKRDASIACWGMGTSGQLGSGLPYTRSSPARVALPPAAQITAAYHQSCARLVDGSVRCWGSQAPRLDPKLAATCDDRDGTSEELRCPSPLAVLPPGSSTAIGGVGPVCARGADGAWRCDTYNTRPGRPTPVRGVKGALSSLSTYGFSVFGVAGGRVYEGAYFALPGERRTVLPALSPVSWAKGLDVSHVSNDGTCAITRSGDVACACDEGLLRASARCATREGAFVVPELRGAKAIVRTPNRDVCTIDASDRLRCFRDQPIPTGFGPAGRVAPALVTEGPAGARLEGVVALAASSMFEAGKTSQGPVTAAWGGSACAVTRAGDVHCWGAGAHGQLGDPARPASTATPRRVEGLPPVEEVALGESHACARTRAGEVYCWGSDLRGQLGVGTRGSAATPVPVALPVIP